MPNFRAIILSYPTAGPSGYEIPAATAAFFSEGYTPPYTGRSIGSDIVHNKNGVFKYVYDNGPNFDRWEPFQLRMEDTFATAVGGTATVQYQALLDMWNHVGQLQMSTPDGIYSVYWAPGNDLARRYVGPYPKKVGDKIEYSVQVQFEQA